MLQNLMGKAYADATKSPDPSNQNGAVLVQREVNGDLTIVAQGHNHFYPGIPPDVEDRDNKMNRIEHAERDCCFNAAARGVCTQGTILICPWAACYECARAIIGCKIHAVVYHKQRYHHTPKRWIDNVNEALGWLADAGVWLYEFDGPVPGTKPVIVNGEPWSPASLSHVPGGPSSG